MPVCSVLVRQLRLRGTNVSANRWRDERASGSITRIGEYVPNSAVVYRYLASGKSARSQGPKPPRISYARVKLFNFLTILASKCSSHHSQLSPPSHSDTSSSHSAQRPSPV